MSARWSREFRFIAAIVDLAPDECWEWKGTLNEEGYGRFHAGGAHTGAHRVAYELWIGPIPEGFTIDHLCRNRACVNPKHLEAVTRVENIRRGFGVAGLNRRKTHCDRGHEFTAENTKPCGPQGQWRECRTCLRNRQRLAWHKRKERVSR